MSDKPQVEELPQPLTEPGPKPPKRPMPMPTPDEQKAWDPERQDKPPEKPVKP